ncbi:AGE family epimerase/isomerase [Rhizomicrobium electricum]|uniref:AGE family epimerase/isomerase n=1 Tax=Rhizomicrobium electricum TaxID=480070 RepID=A0ABP3Q5N1_9PROT|nr:AGE family epimerase/isomerase [Rhizomicrobium electricum]NIJ50475.1 mannose-6-phosphate isomerase [Rhizomicrobium electricum]
MKQDLRAVTATFEDWLFTSALPLWWQSGADHDHGGFRELLGEDGKPAGTFRRARVQGRQSYVYAQAGVMGWNGPWRDGAPHGLAYLKAHYAQPNGQFCTLVSERGEVLKPDTLLYDQAFALLATATMLKTMPERDDLRAAGHALFDSIVAARKHPAGGFVETGDKPFLSNPHMHFLESLLAWCEVEPDGIWGGWADHIADLARTKFIDAEHGFLREYFAADWSPAPGADGHVVEPGHQFEWAWLLMRWGKLRGHPEIRPVCRRLFDHGCRGVDPKRDAAVHAMNDDFKVTVPTARLWAQTERIKAALMLADGEEALVAEALKGAATLWRYLDTPVRGLWWDRFEPDGHFVKEPAPASSLYHIICCIDCMRNAVK